MPKFRSLRPDEVPRFLAPAADGQVPAADGRVPAADGRVRGRASGRRPATSPTPQRYDAVVVPLRLGLEAVDILRLRQACGSVVQGTRGATLSFLVPVGTAGRWHLPGTSAAPGATPLAATDPRWLVPPAGSEALAAPTDPGALRSALCEAARTLIAGGLGPS
ncbi:hypothetical protein [Kitasatospora sp. NBC_01266]|uniref:hypothetical protein n=1 Tax=Kitasatospora sp. NBC_01266 TaxID=2903572 RepID=UPI002E366CF4|nr:hypothetical protein [Kitasatospora sp. NBC_01266]